MGSALVTPITATLMSLAILFCVPAAIIVFIVSRFEKDTAKRKKLAWWSLGLVAMPFVISVIGGIVGLILSASA